MVDGHLNERESLASPLIYMEHEGGGTNRSYSNGP